MRYTDLTTLKSALLDIGLRSYEVEMLLSLEVGEELHYQKSDENYTTVIIATHTKTVVFGEGWMRYDFCISGIIRFFMVDEEVGKYRFEVLEERLVGEDPQEPIASIEEVIYEGEEV